jgi:teichuronic acid biosynthesis glycosyltransferase TuaG
VNDSLVSVIIPMYNAARYIEETIHSALAQTHDNLEVLAVDDCSSDGTRDVVAAMAAADPRVRLLLHQQNAGPAAGRNTALTAARGRYIAFLDADDLWLPGKLEAQVKLLRETGVGMSYTPYRRISATGELISPLITVPPVMDYRASCRNTAMMTSTVIVDRERSGPFQMKALYYDDYACWLELLGRGITARAVQVDLMRYRVLPRSVSRNKVRSAAKVWEVYRKGEQLPLPQAVWCFSGYAWNAVKKYYLTG